MASIETISVLLTDLVGSTHLESRVGPAAAHDLRREHFSVLRDAVAATGGREVKNTGDGLMVVFGSAVGAVECAVRMQQSIELRNRVASEQLSIRIGVSLGDSTAEEGDYFGMPVIEATRLCGAAAGGQILTTEVVRALAGGRGEHRFGSFGATELKGIADPVLACDVQWEPALETAATASADTRIQLCGKLLANLDGRRVEDALPGRQGRLLFAYLVAERPRPVRREALSELLWPERPSASADASLRPLVSRLRQVLGAHLVGRSELSVALPANARVDVDVIGRCLHEAESAVALCNWRGAWLPAQICVEHQLARVLDRL